MSNKDRTVIFLGAGGVHDTGLPLMVDLLCNMKIFVDTYTPSIHKSTFDQFFQYLEEYHNRIGQIINLSELGIQHKDIEINLEIIFTHIHTDILSANISNYSNVHSAKKFIKIFDSCISDFFAHKANDYYNRYYSGDNISYLEKMIDSTNTIITTNWDAMIEMELLRKTKELPTNIYGDRVKLDITDEIVKRAVEKGIIKKRNQLKTDFHLHKVHGSAGWFLSNNRIIVDRIYRNLLSIGGPSTTDDFDRIMIYPSFIKQINDPIMCEIWTQAMRAMIQAEFVEIVGYSLPEADQAVRSMLLLLRNSNKKIIIIEKGREQEKKWRKFLGKNISYYPDGAKKYYKQELFNSFR